MPSKIVAEGSLNYLHYFSVKNSEKKKKNKKNCFKILCATVVPCALSVKVK